ncbi:hypothetical protein PFISCL1PPCAC_22107, partial [Pristionchus fissidentatus]
QRAVKPKMDFFCIRMAYPPRFVNLNTEISKIDTEWFMLSGNDGIKQNVLDSLKIACTIPLGE